MRWEVPTIRDERVTRFAPNLALCHHLDGTILLGLQYLSDYGKGEENGLHLLVQAKDQQRTETLKTLEGLEIQTDQLRYLRD